MNDTFDRRPAVTGESCNLGEENSGRVGTGTGSTAEMLGQKQEMPAGMQPGCCFLQASSRLNCGKLAAYVPLAAVDHRGNHTVPRWRWRKNGSRTRQTPFAKREDNSCLARSIAGDTRKFGWPIP